LVVAFGLGNPGDRYDDTRHNIGKEVVASLARSLHLPLRPGRGEFMYARDPVRDLYLALSTVYVNTSGVSVVNALEFFGATPEGLLVVFDDFSLPLGNIRIRERGGDGGHNGLASIIYQLDSEEFPRLRVGVGPLPEETDPAEFVLSCFPAEERRAVDRMKKRAGEALLKIATEGIESAMNAYNRKVES
jgi:PTH1 family peptidyl-tRNA hydrolase